jgi:hypothetical protein
MSGGVSGGERSVHPLLFKVATDRSGGVGRSRCGFRSTLYLSCRIIASMWDGSLSRLAVPLLPGPHTVVLFGLETWEKRRKTPASK